MAKLTRKQYTRKHLFMGIVILTAVVLLVTGLSIWLLFGTLSQSASGNLGVSQVAVSPMSFESLRIDNVDISQKDAIVENAFIFDSRYNDDSGRVTWDGESYEKRSISVSGTLKHADCLEKFYYRLELPSGIIEAAKAGYLDISEFYDEDWNVRDVVPPEIDLANIREGDDGISYLVFKFNVTIKWGEAFGGENPSDYFDRPAIREEVSDEEVERILNEFRDMVIGTSVFSGSRPTFTLTLTADPNQ